jgi:L-threonylcarbamoyladenylate synthase
VAPIRIDLADPSADLSPLVEALVAGRSAVIPTDTVYGLVCAAHLADACERTLRLKGREPDDRPSAIVCATVDSVFTTVLPELFGRAGVLARRVLPGPVTVVVPNPGRRFRWLCGANPAAIGLRVPVLEPRLAAALDRVGGVLATSANRHGGSDPTTLEDVPSELRERVAVVVDGGATAGGAPSTVVDLCGPEPRVLRVGAIPAAGVLALLAGAPPGAA